MTDTLALHLAPDVSAAALGDQRAFGRLVDATRSTVSSITLAILRDVELSGDVAQEVYLMAWRDLRKLREPTSFLPWLRQLTRNRAHQALRAHVRHRRRFEAQADEALAAAADARPGTLERMMAEEDRALVRDAIDGLPAAAREVVVLYYREGRSAAQVAALLDLSEDAVKQRLSRARSSLRAAVIARIENSAPTEAFSAGVLALVSTIALPATASAMVLGAGKAGKAAGVLPALAGASAVGMLAGLLGGWAGVFLGTRELLRLARDEEERRGVLQLGALQMAGTLGFVAAIALRPTPLTATIGFAGMVLVIGGGHFLWLPRITARRVAAELEEDPVSAAAEHARRRRTAVLGCAFGLVMGGAAVLASWFF